ncbi:hypothetical protein KP509_30G026100 [Ceratopteris richardii]|uniref:Uncharacterized protein n=1 Tax=Ceratopteris richardii TaxID=49495 RepID=A0A8T2R111_CERRI|nr:hypothetical protein KP509_30G026100 [Ceratopteris richardii]
MDRGDDEEALASPDASSATNPPASSPSSWRTAIFGHYDWSFLCMPRSPFQGPTKRPPFYSKDEKIPLFLALIMGLQHALAMVGGIITAPVIIAGSANFSSPKTEAYLVAAALIVTSLASFVQVYQFRVPFTKYVIGSGLLSVMGISFAYIPVGCGFSHSAQHVLTSLQACSCNGVPCQVNGSCQQCAQPLEGQCRTGEEAYGAILGTILVVCWFQTAVSFLSPKTIRRIFPPVVTGTCLILVGVSLVATGFELWGGGQYCASQVLTTKVPCTGNGDVVLPFGSKYYIGLGFVVFLTFVLVEMFGSPFMKNTQVIIALLVSMIVAGLTHVTLCKDNCAPAVCSEPVCYEILPQGVHYNLSTNQIMGTPISRSPNSTFCTQPTCAAPVCSGSICTSFRYLTGKQIASADWVTFLWTQRFPLSFYGPAVLPLLVASIVAATECIGDVTATTEASGLPPYGVEYEQSIQGALLADGLNAFWAALGTTIPLTTYAQNNGVISLSRCASRRAGYACCFWLFVLGILAKFAAIFISIPNCILGALTACLVASVVVSGIHVLNSREGLTRRNRFIATLALGIGLGVNLVPTWVNIVGQSGYPNEGNFWPVDPDWSPGYRGFRDALVLFISNGFSVGGFTAFALNLILPYEESDDLNMHDIGVKGNLEVQRLKADE